MKNIMGSKGGLPLIIPPWLIMVGFEHHADGMQSVGNFLMVFWSGAKTSKWPRPNRWVTGNEFFEFIRIERNTDRLKRFDNIGNIFRVFCVHGEHSVKFIVFKFFHK